MTTAIVIDASAGVELLLNTDTGEALRSRLPRPATEWVPEIYYAEVAAALRRAELHGRMSAARTAIAVDRLLAMPMRRVQVKTLLAEVCGRCATTSSSLMPSMSYWRATSVLRSSPRTWRSQRLPASASQ